MSRGSQFSMSQFCNDIARRESVARESPGSTVRSQTLLPRSLLSLHPHTLRHSDNLITLLQADTASNSLQVLTLNHSLFLLRQGYLHFLKVICFSTPCHLVSHQTSYLTRRGKIPSQKMKIFLTNLIRNFFSSNFFLFGEKIVVLSLIIRNIFLFIEYFKIGGNSFLDLSLSLEYSVVYYKVISAYFYLQENIWGLFQNLKKVIWPIIGFNFLSGSFYFISIEKQTFKRIQKHKAELVPVSFWRFLEVYRKLL